MIQEINQMPTCKTHKGLSLEFFNTDFSTENKQIALCARCLTSSFVKGQDLLHYSDISELNDSDVLNNWPILEDQNTLQILQRILEQKEDQEDYLLIIEQFIDDMLNKINYKLCRMKKAVINYFSESFVCKQKIISKYNEISCKQELKNSLQLMMEGNQSGLEQIENIFKKSYEKKSVNQQILLDQIQKYKANQEFLQLKFPKIVQKQLFQNIKLIKKHLLNKVLQPNKNSLDSFKDYFSECICASNQDTDYLKEIQLSNQQFEFLIQNAQFHIQKKQQLSKLDKNNLNNQNNNIIEQLERINKEHKNFVSQFNIKEQQQFENLVAMYEFDIDASQKYPFIKSLKDEYSQNNQIIKKNKEGLIKIKQINSKWAVQFFTEKAIDASKMYTIQIEIKPFKGEENSYRIAIGFIEISLCNEQWLDQDISSISSLYVSNYNKNKFTLNKKGMLLNNSLINHSELMRKLEIQFCLKQKFFQIADYPGYNNITQARGEEMLRNLDGQEYVFGMKHYSVKSIKVLKFTEKFMQKN
ncbi:hypothetical protein TTHERM_00925440 (macronuclear) [Tetrahymena thermophila SB210]|uniref:Zinc carboxypeptidase family protein n=1 Tax=Tetrahymena thermophila (strain SB210) TaxID=312017 RepID=Q22E14_TETTS|nr:hypothetical protein TTHERM_00925440 [Tetrahymena thermophila SB210]EAR83498.1 hypothetical protein TTHERM_00925440 [Tetrahymena thermophila SB210]|eukprot:XP_001031161.1 hypothetical protein TTHERM_00925440 [Tetrahymena thermophila SB210]